MVTIQDFEIVPIQETIQGVTIQRFSIRGKINQTNIDFSYVPSGVDKFTNGGSFINTIELAEEVREWLVNDTNTHNQLENRELNITQEQFSKLVTTVLEIQQKLQETGVTL